jgi:transposase
MRPRRQGFASTSADLDDVEWRVIEPLLPKSRGIRRVDDRRVLNGILWRLRTGRAWAAIPERYASPATCHARFLRWREAGLWSSLVHAVSHAHHGQVDLLDASFTGVPPRNSRQPAAANDVVAWLALPGIPSR